MNLKRLIAVNVKIGLFLHKQNKTYEDHIIRTLKQLKNLKHNFIKNNQFFDGDRVNKLGEKRIEDELKRFSNVS